VTAYFAEHAWIGGRTVADVRIEIDAGRIAAVGNGQSCRSGDTRISGLVLPGFADTHGHAFHRALRGRTSGGGGSFWTWRAKMYELAARLNPDNYRTLARAVFAELALTGVTTIGEFHYLHHPAAGRYADANDMGHVLVEAAALAGVRITLLDTCFLTGGLGPSGHLPLDPVQRRFADVDFDEWAARVAELRDGPGVRIGVAAHSVRSVPREAIAAVAASAGDRPLHVHLSEQPAENEQCQLAYGCSPTQLLAAEGFLGTRTTAVHATHLSTSDIAMLGSSGTTISMCPTTERDLADGLGHARALRDAGSAITLGTDQHVLADLFEEARALEMHERLASGERGRFEPTELVEAMTSAGHAALGWPDAGRIAVGARADLVAVRLDSVRMAGTGGSLLAASAADVHTVIVDGRVIVSEGRHVLGDVARLLAEAIDELWTT
jgi:formiminoglutamate deiminase